MNVQIYERYKNWQFKNTALLILVLIILIFLSKTPFLIDAVNKIGSFGYLSSFVSGAFFVSIYTVAPATIILYDLAEKLNPLLVAVTAGTGAVVGDYMIFRFLKDRVFKELAPLFSKFTLTGLLAKTFKTPYFAWTLPLIGAFIIASPLPDEVGVSILGLSKIKKWQFVLVTFLLNSVGILIVITIARSF